MATLIRDKIREHMGCAMRWVRGKSEAHVVRGIIRRGISETWKKVVGCATTRIVRGVGGLGMQRKIQSEEREKKWGLPC